MPASDDRHGSHDPHPFTGDVYAEGSAPPPRAPEDSSEFEPDPRRGRILAVLLASLFMALVAVSIINVALPSIQRDLGASSSDLQWVLSGYALSFGVVLVAAGRAGDLFGRERLFVAGMALFTVASLAAALAPTPLMLNLSRVFMGIGSGLINPQVSGLIQQHYRGSERARAFGYFGGIVGVAVAIGPVMGGLLIGMLPPGLGWRSTIGINVPLGLIILALSTRWLNLGPSRTSTQRRSHDLDPVGAVMLAVAVLTVMLPFMLAEQYAAAWALLPVGLVLTAAWVVWERRYQARGRAPMVDMRLFRIRSYSLGTLMIGVYFTGGTTIWVIQAQLVQQGLGESALIASLLGLPGAVLTALAAQLGGRLVTRIGRWTVVIGLVVVLAGITGTLLVTPHIVAGDAPLWMLGAVMAPIGFGAGMVTSPNQTLTLREVPVAEGGTASAIMQTGQRIGTAVGSAGVTGIYFFLLPQGADRAADTAYLIIGGIVVLALIVALTDALTDPDGGRIGGSRRREVR